MYVGILNEYTCRSVLSSSGYNYLKTMIIVAFSLSQIYWLNIHWIFSKYLIFCKTELSIGFIIMYLILSQISTVLCILYMCITYKYEIIYIKINYGAVCVYNLTNWLKWNIWGGWVSCILPPQSIRYCFTITYFFLS